MAEKHTEKKAHTSGESPADLSKQLAQLQREAKQLDTAKKPQEAAEALVQFICKKHDPLISTETNEWTQSGTTGCCGGGS